MKFLILLCVFIATASSASLDGNKVNSDTVSIKENYKKGLVKFKKTLNTRFFPKLGDYLGSIVERKIDYDCVAEKLEKYKLHEKLSEIVANYTGFIDTDRLKEVFYVFVKPVPKCFGMTRAISNTIFDLIMSLGHIMRSFKDEPELAEYMDQFKCANNFAYEMNLLNSSVYPYTYTEVPNCGELWKRVCDEIKVASGNDSCLAETALDSIEFIVRTVLLTQFELTQEQHQKESDCFFNGYIAIADKAGLCGFREYVDYEILKTMHPITGFTMDFASNA